MKAARPLTVGTLVMASVAVGLGRWRATFDVVTERHPTSQRMTRVRSNHLGLRGPGTPAREPRRAAHPRARRLDHLRRLTSTEDETYQAALERRLQAAAPARVVRVINGGGPNVGTM